ncbi:MAG: Flagellum site-determining protein YlxH [Alphaproteobacteria bacterium ADurb.Bin438]|nr:MAG: Flagellum site-determining protein YlxH [Alphaproteobacteria bacterium ADurb.Bin438]
MNTTKLENKFEMAPRPDSKRGRNTIAIASGKGGVGKTWFSITLAHALAKMNEKILLFDADFGLANIDIQLGLMAKYDLGNVLTKKITLNQAVIKDDHGFDVIAGRSGSGSLANIPFSHVQSLNNDLLTLSSNYSKVIVDLGAGVERPIRETAKNCGKILVLCTDEPTSLTDAYAFIKVLNIECPGLDMRIVINSANSVKEGEKTYETLRRACNGFLKISPPLAGIIRRDPRVREAIRHQTSILTRYPNADASEDVMNIARNLIA